MTDLDPVRRAALIERYRAGHAAVVEALAGITDAELDARPAGEGEWTAREIAHHLADSELTSAIRLRRLIAEDEPVIVGYDGESSPGGCTTPSGRSARRSTPLAAARATTADILDRLTEAEWPRTGTHTRERPLRRRAVARDLRVPPARSRRRRSGAYATGGLARRRRLTPPPTRPQNPRPLLMTNTHTHSGAGAAVPRGDPDAIARRPTL